MRDFVINPWRNGHLGGILGEREFFAQKKSLSIMKPTPRLADRIAGWTFRSGKLGWIFLWLIGIPIPVLLILFLLRGCT